jgi:late competence protein required for DNA uptake (superfamily II DNA/RNA helicase)
MEATTENERREGDKMSEQKTCERCEEQPATENDGYWAAKRWCEDCRVWLDENAQETAYTARERHEADMSEFNRWARGTK